MPETVVNSEGWAVSAQGIAHCFPDPTQVRSVCRSQQRSSLTGPASDTDARCRRCVVYRARQRNEQRAVAVAS